MKIKTLNIDHNTTEQTIYPVMFTPQKISCFLKQPELYFLETVVEWRSNPSDVLFFDNIQVQVLPATLKVDEHYFGIFLDASSSIMSAWNLQK